MCYKESKYYHFILFAEELEENACVEKSFVCPLKCKCSKGKKKGWCCYSLQPDTSIREQKCGASPDMGLWKNEVVLLRPLGILVKRGGASPDMGISRYIPVHFMYRAEFQLDRASTKVQIQTT